MKLQIFHCKSDTYQKKIQKSMSPKKTESALNYKYSYKKILKSIIMTNETQ